MHFTGRPFLHQRCPPAFSRPPCIRRVSGLAEHDPHGVLRAVVRELEVIRPQRHAVNFEGADTAADAVRVLDLDVVLRRAVTVSNLEFAPPARHARVLLQARAAQLKAEN